MQGESMHGMCGAAGVGLQVRYASHNWVTLQWLGADRHWCTWRELRGAVGQKYRQRGSGSEMGLAWKQPQKLAEQLCRSSLKQRHCSHWSMSNSSSSPGASRFLSLQTQNQL